MKRMGKNFRGSVELLLVFLLLMSGRIFAGNQPPKDQLMAWGQLQVSDLIPAPSVKSIIPYYGLSDEVTAYSITYESPDRREYNLLISADQNRNPVLRHSEGSDPEFKSLEKMTKRLLKKMDNPVYLSSWFFGFGEIWHQFSDGDKSFYINMNPLRPVLSDTEFQNHKNTMSSGQEMNQAQGSTADEWERFTTQGYLSPQSSHYIPSYSEMPNFDWHGGCTPTAAADIFGYYDNVYGYGNLCKYYYKEEDDIEGDTDRSIPDCLETLRDRLGTDDQGGTPAVQARGKKICQAAEDQDSDYSWNDRGMRYTGIWNKVKSEIDDGYPVLLSVVISGGGHSVPIMGYKDSPEEFYLYDTWNEGATWWDKDLYNLRSVAWFHPALSNQNKGIYLTSLKRCCSKGSCSSESIYADEYNTISWDSDQSNGKVSLYINTNSGNGTWTKIVDLDDNPGSYDWLTPDTYVGSDCRIRARWWNSDKSEVKGEDSSCRDFSILSNTLPQLTNGMVLTETFPGSYSCAVSSNYWCIAGIKTDDWKTATNRIELYSNTDFNTAQASDTIGVGTNRYVGFCVLNLTGGPSGPLGVQVAGDGDGKIQYVESEEIGWGESEATFTWDDDDVVKAFHFHVGNEVNTIFNNNYLRLNNIGSSADFSMTLFDTHKRFSSYSDGLITVDDNGQGADEEILLDQISGLSGRYVVVVWQNRTTIRSGEIGISLVSESAAMTTAPIVEQDDDTLKYSGIRRRLPNLQSKWTAVGTVPIEKTNWKIAAVYQTETDTVVRVSDVGYPFMNMILVKKPDGLPKDDPLEVHADSIKYLFTRKGAAGNALLRLSKMRDSAPISDGSNSGRTWPQGKCFMLFPISSQHPLKNLNIDVTASDGKPLACGIAPDGNRQIVTANMLWGNHFEPPASAPDIKQGVAVLYRRKPAKSSFTYQVNVTLDETKVSGYVKPPAGTYLRVHTNPFDDILTVEMSETALQTTQIEMYDILGRRISLPLTSGPNTGSQICTFQTHHLTPGIYLIRAAGTDMKPVRVVKVR